MTTDITVAKIGRSMKKCEKADIAHTAPFPRSAGPSRAASMRCRGSGAAGGSAGGSLGVASAQPGRSVGIGIRSGLTSPPGRTCCRPPTATHSSGFKPAVTTRRPSS